MELNGYEIAPAQLDATFAALADPTRRAILARLIDGEASVTELAKPFVAHCTRVTPLAIAMIGPGIAVALAGHPWIGALLVAAGILLRRAVKSQAPRILLHLVARMPSVYEQATEHGVMEVRRA